MKRRGAKLFLIRTTSCVILSFLFLVSLCVALNLPAQAKPGEVVKVTEADGRIIRAEIERQAGGDEALKNWLIGVNRVEAAGYSTWTAPNKAGTSAIGPMQILEAATVDCIKGGRRAAGLSITFAELRANMRSADPEVASKWSVACAISYKKNQIDPYCHNLKASLCAYYDGPSWCRGIKKLGLPPMPDAGGCRKGNYYDVLVCKAANIDCETGVMGKTEDGKDSVQAGEVMNSGANGGAPETGQINCPDLDLASAMQEATAAFSNAAIINARTTFEASPRSDIRAMQCLDLIPKYFDLIRALLNGLNAMVTAVAMLVKSILNMACDYVRNALQNLIDSALSFLCIPTLPGLPRLSTIPARACNGSQLLTFGAGSAMAIPGGVPPFFVNMSRGIVGPAGTFRF